MSMRIKISLPALEKVMKAEKVEQYKLKKLLINALIIRLFICVLVLLVGKNMNEIYFISDDAAYENLAKAYLQSASSPIDLGALTLIGATGYLQIFWPYVVCISAYVFHSIYAARFINVFLSILTIKLIYDLTKSISNNHPTAIRAARIYAYLPYPILVCCFPIKDIYLTVAVLYVFVIFIKFQNLQKITIIQFILSIMLLIGAYFTRGGVVEMMSLFFIAFLMKRFADTHNYAAIMLCITFTFVFLYVFGGLIFDSFSIKIDNYGGYAQMDTTISAIQMSSVTQIYKLPFTYFFASLQPIPLSLFTPEAGKMWSQLIYYGNLTMIPVACGNFLYIFYKKKNSLFWICSAVMYCAVTTLSLGIFRHYLFLLPLEMINYSLYMENATQVKRSNCLVFAACCFVMILLYSCYCLIR